MQRRRLPGVPELLLGLVAIGVAIVLTALVTAGAIRDTRRRGDTITVTGSAHKPITSNLVRWSIGVADQEPTAAAAARRLQLDLATVQQFLRAAGVPSEAMSLSVVDSEQIVERLPKQQKRISYRVSQRIDLTTGRIEVVRRLSTRLGELIERGIDVSPEPVEYLSTELTEAKFAALGDATADARRRAEVIARGLGAKLGGMRSSSLGVYQITPRNSTEVSDYGINDTSTRDKDVTAVISVTFAVHG